jgi:hypothetical protein
MVLGQPEQLEATLGWGSLTRMQRRDQETHAFCPEVLTLPSREPGRCRTNLPHALGIHKSSRLHRGTAQSRLHFSCGVQRQ